MHLVGNPMIDTLIANLDKFDAAAARAAYGLGDRRYVVATLHRPANVDSPERAAELVRALHEVAAELDVLIPLHPRGRATLTSAGLFSPGGATPPDERPMAKTAIVSGAHPALPPGGATPRGTSDGKARRSDAHSSRIHVTEPLGYIEFMSLVRGAAAIVTDSGGVQEETTLLRVPCLTLRPNTERPITITSGSNRLVTRGELAAAVLKACDDGPYAGELPPLWDGHAGPRIARIVTSWLAQR
jgi:UDP-N-acetylglucosamine 2-epimerase (non-hydrolysing)